jgi:ketosteroid isomerase-like protein
MDDLTRSETPLELVRRAFERFEEGDLEGMLELVHPEAEFHPAFYPGSYRGRESIRAAFVEGGTRRSWRVVDRESEQVADRVLVKARLLSRESLGGTMDLPIAWVFDTDQGLITRMEGFVHPQQALSAIADRSGQNGAGRAASTAPGRPGSAR